MTRLAALWLSLLPCCAAADITGARYADPTTSYGHGALANGEYAALEITIGRDRVIVDAPQDAVYEDTAPRLVDLDNDGKPEVVTVISDFQAGAAIRVFAEIPAPAKPTENVLAIVAESQPIGARHRWLAIIGVADLDGDGLTEIAYIDRPHLAKVLRVLQVRPGQTGWDLVEVAAASGLTNHHIGSPEIEGGLRRCAGGIEMITANAGWTRIIATKLSGGQLIARDLGAYGGPASLTAAMTCP